MQSSPGTEHGEGAGQATTEDLRAQLGEAQAELAAMNDRYLRARADLENYRKRAQGDLERRVEEQRDEILRSWLDAVDSVERALALADDPRLAEDLQVFLGQMEGILRRYNVKRSGVVGEQFDPELHEAIAVVPSDGQPAGTIAEVAQSGYLAGNRMLRPAQVAVTRRVDVGD
jgi:molecular chaperone GrpE